jgi:hypothetical protein
MRSLFLAGLKVRQRCAHIVLRTTDVRNTHGVLDKLDGWAADPRCPPDAERHRPRGSGYRSRVTM